MSGETYKFEFKKFSWHRKFFYVFGWISSITGYQFFIFWTVALLLKAWEWENPFFSKWFEKWVVFFGQIAFGMIILANFLSYIVSVM